MSKDCPRTFTLTRIHKKSGQAMPSKERSAFA